MSLSKFLNSRNLRSFTEENPRTHVKIIVIKWEHRCIAFSSIMLIIVILHIITFFFIPALKHFLNRQYLHWFLLSLSTTHCRLNTTVPKKKKRDIFADSYHLSKKQTDRLLKVQLKLDQQKKMYKDNYEFSNLMISMKIRASTLMQYF